MRRTGLGLLLSTALAAAALTGCGSGVFGSAERCLPEPLSVDPAQVVVGGSVTVSSPAFSCGTRYPEGKHYALSLSPGGGTGPVELGSYPVERDGSFRATVTVPASAPPGEADLAVSGSPFDQPCDDGESSCAVYSTLLTLLPPP